MRTLHVAKLRRILPCVLVCWLLAKAWVLAHLSKCRVHIKTIELGRKFKLLVDVHRLGRHVTKILSRYVTIPADHSYFVGTDFHEQVAQRSALFSHANKFSIACARNPHPKSCDTIPKPQGDQVSSAKVNHVHSLVAATTPLQKVFNFWRVQFKTPPGPQEGKVQRQQTRKQ